MIVILFKISKWNKMENNKEKFLDLVSKEPNNTSARNKERIAKRAMLRESRNIAFKVLERLDELNWKQKDLAKAMGVSAPYVNKLVKGKENFTLETLVKLQQILDIPILASYQENTEKVSIMEQNTVVQTEEIFVEFSGEEQTTIVQASDSYSYSRYISLTVNKNINQSSGSLCAC